MPVSMPAQTTVIEKTALPVEPVQFTPIPTLKVEVQATAGFPTFTTPPTQAGQSNVIRFAANGTYADITDAISTGSSKVYSVKAAKGQIMSISILPQLADGGWGYIPIQIRGADGIILCPQYADLECLFWRGELPASQNYFITLTPVGEVPQFILRVAINPPGTVVQYFQYNNLSTGLSLVYPDTFVPASPVVGNYKTNPELTLHLIDSKTYDKTNLGEVYLFISSTSDAQVAATCTQPNQNGGAPEQVIGNETINGYTFAHSTAEGAGAGNYYEQEIYRMVNKNICYEVIYFIHSSNIGNYPPGVVTEFNRADLIQRFDSIFSTFTIK